MKYTRQYVEMKGRAFRSIQDATEDWYQVTIFNGVKMYCRKDDTSVTPSLSNEGFWEAWITAWLLNNLESGDRFIDIGANTGYYSFVAVDLGARVLAYEPNMKYVEMMRASQEIDWVNNNKAGELVPPNSFTVMPMAVSDQAGEVTLTVPESLQGSATIRDVDLSAYNPTQFTVPTVNLDFHTAGLSPSIPTIIKVDAEGAEEMVWNGAFTTNYRLKPTWMLEYTPGAYDRKFLDNLEAYGDLMWIDYSGEEQPITQNEIISQADWIMLVVRPRAN